MSEEQKYYRTGQGSHRHANYDCANQRRSIFTGDPIELTTKEWPNWEPCEHCCSAHEVKAWAVIEKAAAEQMCRNNGVTHPRRIYSECRDCGKTGKVNRNMGTLRAHKPQQN